MKKIVYLICLLGITASLVYANNGKNDYDEICRIYTDAYHQESFNKLSASERAGYINQKIEETLQPGEALDALRVIAQADPKEKYKLLKQVAEMSTGKNWDCPAIKNANLSY